MSDYATDAERRADALAFSNALAAFWEGETRNQAEAAADEPVPGQHRYECIRTRTLVWECTASDKHEAEELAREQFASDAVRGDEIEEIEVNPSGV